MSKRKIDSPEQMAELWEAYKVKCDNHTIPVHEFSQKNSEFVTAELRKPVSYTIEGFCVFVRMSRETFYESYAKDDDYLDIVELIKLECESDVRQKFETGVISSKLSALWMSKHGYSVKTETNVTGSVPVVIENDLAK